MYTEMIYLLTMLILHSFFSAYQRLVTRTCSPVSTPVSCLLRPEMITGTGKHVDPLVKVAMVIKKP